METNTSLAVYPDNTYTTAITAAMKSYLGQFIYVEIEMFSFLGDFIPYNCLATETNDINSPTAYYLIQNGLVLLLHFDLTILNIYLENSNYILLDQLFPQP